MRGLESVAADAAMNGGGRVVVPVGPELAVEIDKTTAMARMGAIAAALGAESVEGLRAGWVNGAGPFDCLHMDLTGRGRPKTARFVDRYFGLDERPWVDEEHVV